MHILVGGPFSNFPFWRRVYELVRDLFTCSVIMESLIEEVRKQAAVSDDVERIKLIDSSRNLSYEIEASQDTFERVVFNVRRL